VVYPAGFGKATSDSIEHIERAYRPIIKRSLGVASSFPNDVFHAATEHDGLGIPRLLDEVTKTRLRHFQSMISSRNSAERQLAKASLHIAQRWFLGCCGGTSGGTSATSGGATGTSGAGGTSAGGEVFFRSFFW
jgi:hypothetical protein